MNQAQKDIDKRLLDLEEQRKIKEAEERFTEHNNNGKLLSEIGIIKVEYNLRKQRIDEENSIPLQNVKENQLNLGDRPKPKLGDSRLEFNPDDGITIYRGAEYIFTGKRRALLTFLSRSKNTPFPIDDIKDKCNPNITNRRYYFKAQKDVYDTVAYIRKNLKVKNGEFFPIKKTENNWIWLEK